MFHVTFVWENLTGRQELKKMQLNVDVSPSASVIILNWRNLQMGTAIACKYTMLGQKYNFAFVSTGCALAADLFFIIIF